MAVPDFAAGAMENWGLILYRETALLYEEGVSSSAYKQRVAVVIAHELAHMVCNSNPILTVNKDFFHLCLHQNFRVIIIIAMSVFF